MDDKVITIAGGPASLDVAGGPSSLEVAGGGNFDQQQTIIQVVAPPVD